MKPKTKIIQMTVIVAVLFFASVTSLTQQLPYEKNIKFETETSATLVGENGLIMRTDDGGLTWTEQTSGTTNVLNSNDYYSDGGNEYLIAVGENGIVLKSTNLGTTWEIKKSGTTEHLHDIKILNAEVTYACGNNGTLLISPNLGETWDIVPLSTNADLKSLSFYTDASMNQYGFLAGLAVIFKMEVNGTLWQEADVQPIMNEIFKFNCVYMMDENKIFAAGDNGLLVMSNDGGLSWNRIETGFYLNINEIIFTSPVNGVASCDDGYILLTQNGGLTWSAIKTPVNDDLFSVNFANENFGISVGEDGTELYTIDGGLTWTTSLSSGDATYRVTILENSVTQLTNYPNPFNPNTKISYNLSTDAQVTAKVYDMLGRAVMDYGTNFQKAGTHTHEFNASGLSSGIYFYSVKTNAGGSESFKTLRLILTK